MSRSVAYDSGERVIVELDGDVPGALFLWIGDAKDEDVELTVAEAARVIAALQAGIEALQERQRQKPAHG